MSDYKTSKKRSKEIDMTSIGKRIKQKRTELGLTQTQIKDYIGISSGNLSEFELGHRAPSLDAAYKLARLFSCSIDWIVTGDSPKEENTSFSQTGEKYMQLFNSLSEGDQEEIIGFIELKLSRQKRQETSSLSNGEDNGHRSA